MDFSNTRLLKLKLLRRMCQVLWDVSTFPPLLPLGSAGKNPGLIKSSLRRQRCVKLVLLQTEASKPHTNTPTLWIRKLYSQKNSEFLVLFFIEQEGCFLLRNTGVKSNEVRRAKQTNDSSMDWLQKCFYYSFSCQRRSSSLCTWDLVMRFRL